MKFLLSFLNQHIVIPVKTGIQKKFKNLSLILLYLNWIPACMGMTVNVTSSAIFIFTLTIFHTSAHANLVEYSLVVAEKKVNFSGKDVTALSLNDSIPGPTIKAQVGDTLRVNVKNNLDRETSLHWHGVLVPNEMDGVPYVNQLPIQAGETFIYEFPITHSGTYWYHAHSGLQEQEGVYGALVFHEEPDQEDLPEYVLVLSDWTDERPEQVLKHIKQDPDYYALKKDSVQSWYDVLKNGPEAIKIRLKNAWTRMGPMDMSDVGYDAFLINGQKSSTLGHAKPGSRIKLRIINAGASSYFVLNYSGGDMEVIEADGVKVAPFTAKQIRIAMAETYDVIVTIPDNKTYEFRASAEDGTGYATAHIGHGELVPAPHYPKPNLALMDMSSHDMGAHDMHTMTVKHTAPKVKKIDHSEMDHTEMNMSHMENMDNMGSMTHEYDQKPLPHTDYVNNYKSIKSPHKTNLPAHHPLKIFTLRLNGSMQRYVWTINNVPMYASDDIVIKKGENVKFILINETMMNHPIHIHGHFFRVLNGQGDYSPLKHTVNVAPFETVEIEFEANEEKDWILHCHNLYHMKLGMGGTIHYEGTERPAELLHHAKGHSADHGDVWFNATELSAFSNYTQGMTKFMHQEDVLSLDGRYNYHKDYEVETKFQRYVSEFLGLYIAGEFEHEDHETKNRGIIGMQYTLPLLLTSDLRLNHKGKFRFELSQDHQLTDRLCFDWHWNTDHEYNLELNYEITKNFSFSANYDSREQFGLGLEVRF